MANQARVRYTNAMQALAFSTLFMAVAILILVAAIRPRRSSLSLYELERRQKANNPSAQEELRREMSITDVISVIRVVAALLLVVVVAASVATFDFWLGLLVALVVALFYGRIARLEPIHHLAQKLYEQVEPKLITFVERHPKLSGLIRSTTSERVDYRPASRDELEHLIMGSGAALRESEKKLLISNLHFGDRRVEEVMTPRGVITTVKHDTMVGPLTLNDLHQTGHGRFPVIRDDIDHVIGILYIQDLVTLSNKHSQTAEELMEGKVYYIERTQTLREALAAFLHVKHHLFVVINEYRETAGIITLEDVMEAMIGHRIIDEFDVHDDMRIVAARSAKLRNNAPHGTDV